MRHLRLHTQWEARLADASAHCGACISSKNIEYRLLHILSSGANGREHRKLLQAAVSTPLPEADATEE
jgi:hypothetical protein